MLRLRKYLQSCLEKTVLLCALFLCFQSSVTRADVVKPKINTSWLSTYAYWKVNSYKLHEERKHFLDLAFAYGSCKRLLFPQAYSFEHAQEKVSELLRKLSLGKNPQLLSFAHLFLEAAKPFQDDKEYTRAPSASRAIEYVLRKYSTGTAGQLNLVDRKKFIKVLDPFIFKINKERENKKSASGETETRVLIAANSLATEDLVLLALEMSVLPEYTEIFLKYSLYKDIKAEMMSYSAQLTARLKDVVTDNGVYDPRLNPNDARVYQQWVTERDRLRAELDQVSFFSSQAKVSQFIGALIEYSSRDKPADPSLARIFDSKSLSTFSVETQKPHLMQTTMREYMALRDTFTVQGDYTTSVDTQTRVLINKDTSLRSVPDSQRNIPRVEEAPLPNPIRPLSEGMETKEFCLITKTNLSEALQLLSKKPSGNSRTDEIEKRAIVSADALNRMIMWRRNKKLYIGSDIQWAN